MASFNPTRVKQALEEFGMTVLEEARRNLDRRGMNASYKLRNSMTFDSTVSKNSLSAFFYLGPYALAQDQGVDGTEQGRNSPYSFTTDKPPMRMVMNIQDWMADKGIGFSELTSKQKAYAISTNILRNGLKRTLFFTEAYEKGFSTLPDDLIEAFGIDIDDFFNLIID